MNPTQSSPSRQHSGQRQPIRTQPEKRPAVKRARRFLGALAGLACGLLAFAATGPAALAQLQPPGAGGGAPVTPAPAPPVQVVTAGGMAGWQIALIAVGAALLAAAIAVLFDRARSARRSGVTESA
jgi:hypothetical protein